MRPDEFADRLDRLLDELEKAWPTEPKPLHAFWHAVLRVRDFLPNDSATIAPGWFQGVISIGPYAPISAALLKHYRYATIQEYRSTIQGSVESFCEEFLAGLKPLPAYGGEGLLEFRRCGHAEHNPKPIGFLWTCGKNSTHLDQDLNRYVTPPAGYWLREWSSRYAYYGELYFETPVQLAQRIFEGMNLWYAHVFGDHSFAPFECDEAAL